MKLLTTARALTIGFTAAAMIIAVGSTNSYANTHKAKAKLVAATAPQYVHEQPVKMRYYGGPKSPMYP
jgi:hypothetical protein